MCKFTKITSIGNDYIVVCGTNKFPENICDRNLGIGADGIINILKSDKAHYKIEVFNSEGKPDIANANSIICSAKYYYDNLKKINGAIRVETTTGIKNIILSGDSNFSSTIDLGKASLSVDVCEITTHRNILYDYTLYLPSTNLNINFVKMRFPHIIISNGDIYKSKFNLKSLVYDIQHHHLFKIKPYVSFITINSYSNISVITFNGLGEEILSSGESAAASVYLNVKRFKLNNSVNVNFTKGICHCYYDTELQHLIFTSTAKTLFEGKF